MPAADTPQASVVQASRARALLHVALAASAVLALFGTDALRRHVLPQVHAGAAAAGRNPDDVTLIVPVNVMLAPVVVPPLLVVSMVVLAVRLMKTSPR